MKYDRCPICKKPWEECPHSVSDVEKQKDELRIRAIVRDEIKRQVKTGCLSL